MSVRTIYRDIDQLLAAGVPIYAERGPAGGFALHEGWRTRLTGFTPVEAESLLLAGAGARAADLGMGPSAGAAQLKLLASLSPAAGANAQRTAERFHLDPASWYARVQSLPLLPSLAEAVWRDRRIAIRYESWTREVRRELDPLGVVLKAGVWYLVAAADGKPRTYRVDAIRELEVLEAGSRRPARFHLARWWEAWAADFERRLLSQTARVRVTAEGLRVLREVSSAAAATLNDVAPDAAGWVEGDIPVEGGAHAVAQLLRLGPDVEVITPPQLREALRAKAQAVADRHALAPTLSA